MPERGGGYFISNYLPKMATKIVYVVEDTLIMKSERKLKTNSLTDNFALQRPDSS